MTYLDKQQKFKQSDMKRFRSLNFLTPIVVLVGRDVFKVSTKEVVIMKPAVWTPWVIPQCAKSVPLTSKMFWPRFLAYLDGATGRIIIQCPFLNMKSIRYLARYLVCAINRGVAVCVLVQYPRRTKKMTDEQFAFELEAFHACVKHLRSMKIHVTVRTKKHEKLIIIDQCTLFEGSVNVLSPSPSDNIREHFDSEAVSTIIELHELWCEECDKFIPIISTSATTPERITKLGNKLAERRRALDRTARILAQNSDVSKTCLLRLEAGLNGTVSSLLKITEALDFENIQVPKYLVPAVIRVLERAKGKELDQPRPFES